MEKGGYVYIVTNKPYGTLYTGVSSDLARRSFEHREGLYECFTKKYGLTMLVYCEEYPTILEAIHREKCIKKWRRAWKIQIIDKFNPTWRDLFEELNN